MNTASTQSPKQDKFGRRGGVLRSVLMSAVVILGILGIGWSAGDPDARSWETLLLASGEMSCWVSENGLGLLGIAIAILALAITVTSILELQSDRAFRGKRHQLLSECIGYLIEIGMCLSAGVLLMGAVGMAYDISLAVKNRSANLFEESVRGDLIMVSALVILLAITWVYLRIDQILMTNKDLNELEVDDALTKLSECGQRFTKIADAFNRASVLRVGKRTVLNDSDRSRFVLSRRADQDLNNLPVIRFIPRDLKMQQVKLSVWYATIVTGSCAVVVVFARVARSSRDIDLLGVFKFLFDWMVLGYFSQLIVGCLVYSTMYFFKSASLKFKWTDYFATLFVVSPLAGALSYSVISGTVANLGDGYMFWPIFNIVFLALPLVLVWMIPKRWSMRRVVEIHSLASIDRLMSQLEQEVRRSRAYVKDDEASDGLNLGVPGLKNRCAYGSRGRSRHS